MIVEALPVYKDASATTSYGHGLPVSSLHGCNIYKPLLLSGFEHKSDRYRSLMFDATNLVNRVIPMLFFEAVF